MNAAHKYSDEIKATMKAFFETLSEKDRRRYAAIEAIKLGYGGQKYICEVLGCDEETVKVGTEELRNGVVAWERGLNISEHVVKQLLEKHGFANRKMQKAITMKDSKDRNEQFERIQELREEYEQSENPIISIDVKKKRS